jgi:ketosteroid isomerase-like protein
MSQRNVEVVRQGVDAMNRRDPDAFLACLRPDVAWEESGDVFPGLRGTYRGHAEARRWFEEALLEVWDSFHLQTEAISDAGDDRVLLEALFTARGTTSGVETELRFWTVLWFADGKIARRQIFWARDEGLEAAGLSD